MPTLRTLRTKVLKLSQAELAKIVGLDQSRIARWENGTLAPSLPHLAVIRRYAKKHVPGWRDEFFFELPKRGNIEHAETSEA